MNLRRLRPGDVVLCDVRGRTFTSRVLATDDAAIEGHPVFVEPLVPNVSYRHLRPRQVRELVKRGAA